MRDHGERGGSRHASENTTSRSAATRAMHGAAWAGVLAAMADQFTHLLVASRVAPARA
jgi:hypothetical protein